MRGWHDAAQGTVGVSADLDQPQRRATLGHELVHVDQADVGRESLWDDMQQEATARVISARYLVDIRDLAVAVATAASESEVARQLAVDVSTVRRRIEALTPREERYIERVVHRLSA